MAKRKAVSETDAAIVPSGTHQGRRLGSLTDAALAAMYAGWRGGPLQQSAFFLLLERAMVERRLPITTKRKGDQPKRTLLDEFAISIVPVLLRVYLDDGEVLGLESEEWEDVAFNAYKGAEALMRRKEEIEARSE